MARRLRTAYYILLIPLILFLDSQGWAGASWQAYVVVALCSSYYVIGRLEQYARDAEKALKR